MTTQFKAHWFHILLALADDDLHGHGITRRVLDATDGEVRLWPVTLYSSLDELARLEWIRELTGDEHPAGMSNKRRYFRITNQGRQALAAEAKRMHALSTRALEITDR
jgi:DNA-binding PadR family transcriptional regulator